MILADPARIDEYTRRGWWGERTLGDLFREGVARHPGREAAVDPPDRSSLTDGPPRRLDWAALGREVDALSAVLLAHGLRRDDVVAVQLVNSVEQYVAYLACLELGLIVTPLPVQFREHEIDHAMRLTDAAAAITATRVVRWAAARAWTAAAARHPALRTVFAWGRDVPAGAVSLDDAIPRAAGAGRVVPPWPRPGANDVATLCWTSGTEADPKAVPRTHNEWLIVSNAIIEGAELEPGCRLLNPFPLVNMAGWSTCMAAWLRLGATVVQHHPFGLSTFLAQLRDERIDYTVAAPAILTRLLQEPSLLEGVDLHRLRRIGSGSAPLSEWAMAGWAARGVEVVNYFGSNEGAALTGSPRDVPDPVLRARHFPRAGVEGFDWSISTARRIRTRLVDPDSGDEVTVPGRPGELRVSGPTIFSGYWRAPQASARAFDAQGFYRTGDLFEIAGPRGEYYRFAGRLKDVVVRGGMKVSAEEVEALVLGHPGVAEAAVVGLPDPVLGERVCAVVVPREGARVELDELLLHLGTVARYKHPERLVCVDALPRNPVGKVLKRELRARLATQPPDAH